MSLIKSKESAFYSLSLATHGQVDIGALQATGVVTSAATIDVVVNGKNLTSKTNLLITVVGAAAPKVGHTLVISDTDVVASGTITLVSALAADTVTVNGLLYTGVVGAKSDNTEFSIDTSDTAAATDLADSITNDSRSGTLNDVTATSNVGVVTAVQTVSGTGGNATTLVSSNGTRLAVSGALFTGGLDGANGLYPIIKVVDATHYVIDLAFAAIGAGTWTSLGAKGFFVGFMPMTALAAGEITSITFLDVDETSHVGDPTRTAYLAGVFYPFPGGIDEIILSAGNIRLFRYSNNKPQF